MALLIGNPGKQSPSKKHHAIDYIAMCASFANRFVH